MATTGMVPRLGTPTVAKAQSLYASAAALTTGTVTSGTIGNLDWVEKAVFAVSATISGTTTLNVYIQKQLPDGSWTDIVSFTQLSATGVRYLDWISGAMTADLALSDAALTAGSIKAGIVGGALRIKGVVAGAAPNAQFTVYADFYGRL